MLRPFGYAQGSAVASRQAGRGLLFGLKPETYLGGKGKMQVLRLRGALTRIASLGMTALG